MRWLHRLPRDLRQPLAQRVQVGLRAQRGAEGGDGLRRVILAAVETPVNACLDPAPQRSEERDDQQRPEDSDNRLFAALPDERLRRRLESEDQRQVERAGQRDLPLRAAPPRRGRWRRRSSGRQARGLRSAASPGAVYPRRQLAQASEDSATRSSARLTFRLIYRLPCLHHRRRAHPGRRITGE